MARCAILSCADDLHAYLIQTLLRERGLDCDIIETDRVSRNAAITWDSARDECQILTTEGSVFEPRSADLIWYRRLRPQSSLPSMGNVPASIVNNDCRSALLGSILARFCGVWVDYPFDVQRAEHKILQLELARTVGFRIPRTLVSQDVAAVRRFCEANSGGTIVKTLRGVASNPLMTLHVSKEMLRDEAAIRISPCCYQEYVTGSRHVRVNCFGTHLSTIEIESSNLDWRSTLDGDVKAVDLPVEIESTIRKFLAALGLSMGVFDFKIDSGGDLVFLELNPQGQFLFCQGLTGQDLASSFVDFILSSLRATRRRIAIPAVG